MLVGLRVINALQALARVTPPAAVRDQQLRVALGSQLALLVG